ncbi:hypothetical protein GJW-30_1_03241 [Variibacter gotjawalensis]|uniref:Uncharacterized protein n=1 Tax=Variibacter gotjawalensis TaxID=1333996 RepID=A0A0S3PXU5_9BRAD|nr:hypothetical protein [Variibacter gotjawalensis]NIK46526.1 hypothetical protein [Variibacter gotjawalensis]RZS48431.1 hypothetical protein EV661_0844 [Variibacter gotjawalensis]BAT60692.1 hypothetical protein GJW-30_1_03241 [Variibacter gotjawalensis]
MQEIKISDITTGVRISRCAPPSLFRVVIFTASLGFVVWCLWQVDFSQGSWLPPFDLLPGWAKAAILVLSFGAGLAIIVYPIYRGLKILIHGEHWDFDAARRQVRRDGKLILFTTDIACLRVTGDFRGDGDSVELHIVKRDGRKIEVAEATMDNVEFYRFRAAARRISDRLKVPVEIVGLPSRAWGWDYPVWWSTRV